MHTLSLAEYVTCIERDDWQGVGELMLASAKKLANIGADFLICPDNTIHRALPYVELNGVSAGLLSPTRRPAEVREPDRPRLPSPTSRCSRPSLEATALALFLQRPD